MVSSISAGVACDAAKGIGGASQRPSASRNPLNCTCHMYGDCDILRLKFHTAAGQASAWLSSFWRQVREICRDVVDSFCESIRASTQP